MTHFTCLLMISTASCETMISCTGTLVRTFAWCTVLFISGSLFSISCKSAACLHIASFHILESSHYATIPSQPRQSAASVPDPFLPQPLLSREPPASSVFPPAPALEFIPSTAVAAIPPVAAQIQLQPQASTLQQQVSIYPAQLQVRPPSLPEKPSRRKHSSRRHRRPSPSSSSSSSPSSSPSTRSSSGSSRSRRRRRRKHKSKRKEGKKKRGGKTERRSSRHRRDRTRSPSPPSPRPPRAHSPSLSLVEAFPGHIPFESTHRHTVSMPIGPLEGYPPAAPPTARFLRPTASEI